MKRCGMNPFLCFVLSLLPFSAAVLMAAAAQALARNGASPAAYRAAVLAVLVLLLSAASSTRGRMDSLRQWLEYDGQRVVFHFSVYDTRAVGWDEIAGPDGRRWNGAGRVVFRQSLLGVRAAFSDDGKRMTVFRAASGYRAFVRALRERGALL